MERKQSRMQGYPSQVVKRAPSAYFCLFGSVLCVEAFPLCPVSYSDIPASTDAPETTLFTLQNGVNIPNNCPIPVTRDSPSFSQQYSGTSSLSYQPPMAPSLCVPAPVMHPGTHTYGYLTTSTSLDYNILDLILPHQHYPIQLGRKRASAWHTQILKVIINLSVHVICNVWCNSTMRFILDSKYN